MTQVQMTDQQLNRALAVLMGYEVKEGHIGYLPTILVAREVSEDMHVWRYFEPCTNPAASLEVQAAACANDEALYVKHLKSVVYTEKVNQTIGVLLNASPRERAMAAYITLSSV